MVDGAEEIAELPDRLAPPEPSGAVPDMQPARTITQAPSPAAADLMLRLSLTPRVPSPNSRGSWWTASIGFSARYKGEELCQGNHARSGPPPRGGTGGIQRCAGP